jgi:hypothetical protein
MLGSRKNGPDVETRVTKGNQEWVAARADFLRTMAGPDPKAAVTPAPSAKASVPASFFVDPIWGVKTRVKVDNGEYQAAVAKNGQQILDQNGCGKSCEQSLGKKASAR